MRPNATEKEATILFSEMTPEPSWEEEFNDWYDHEHIPLRMAVPGFLGAQRYHVPGTSKYLAIYEMANAGVLVTDSYKKVKEHPSERTVRMLSSVQGFSRYIGEQISAPKNSQVETAMEAPILYAVFFHVPSEREHDFNEWYDVDHITTLLECKDWLMVRRFRIISGEPENWTHLALHYLASEKALESPERARARNSPWRMRLAQESWFQGHYVVFEKHGPCFAPSPRNANSTWT